MSAMLVSVGIFAGGCGSWVAHKIRQRLLAIIAVRTTPRALVVALGRLMTESNWQSFQYGYARLLAATLRYSLCQLLTSLIAVTPIVLAYATLSLLSQSWEPTPNDKHQFGAGQWAFLCSATIGSLVSPWISIQKN